MVNKASEKYIERKLCEGVKNKGGWAIKFLSCNLNGLPDRICLFPGGRLFFVELKSTGKKPKKTQPLIHKKLRELGFEVLVIDTIEGVTNFIESYV